MRMRGLRIGVDYEVSTSGVTERGLYPDTSSRCLDCALLSKSVGSIHLDFSQKLDLKLIILYNMFFLCVCVCVPISSGSRLINL